MLLFQVKKNTCVFKIIAIAIILRVLQGPKYRSQNVISEVLSFLCPLSLVDQIATVVLYSNDSYVRTVAIEDSG